MEARCLKCRKNVEPKDAEIVEMKNPKNPGMKAIKGKCPFCGTKVFKILGKKDIEKLEKDG